MLKTANEKRANFDDKMKDFGVSGNTESPETIKHSAAKKVNYSDPNLNAEHSGEQIEKGNNAGDKFNISENGTNNENVSNANSNTKNSAEIDKIPIFETTQRSAAEKFNYTNPNLNAQHSGEQIEKGNDAGDKFNAS